MNVRAAAAQVIYQVVDQGQSLSTALPAAQQQIKERDQALLQEICYGVLRWLPRLESITQKLMDKPLKGKQRVFHHLILVGLYQLGYMRIPAHAAVAETVNATKNLKKPQLRGLVNAILRNYQRQQQELDAQAVSHDAGKYGHPSWLLKLLKQAYPNDVDAICAANNTKAPMWLRVNRQHHNRDEYRKLLDAEGIATELHPQAGDALRLLSPCDVYKLPGFEQGWVSVQDAAAQLAIEYLQPQAGELILDCCAAPGGKTAHILEHVPSAQVVAIDCDEHRLARVHDNLQRLNLQAKVLCADARYPDKWWDGDKFDRILLDAPCSATGVIRRHPDIKWLRRGEDIAALAQLQAEIFDAMWLQLKSGGTLVYATCSITPQENRDQVSAFLARTADATLVGSEATNPGRQILPSEENMDGFYYAVLQKA
ncbi:16S rRNA (cytosine(967)-C(5))-methyltransferase RsmB [Photobacterium damselae subsp. piscicida]|uniref:Ribosomal RNA small subunit methyltransferase B n=1 Tax=Photobacterium damsela subsp. piscicida TaxID=38294 RepID=A0A1Q9GZF2_PHODP|nr:16S rRNA (cytosine(967)-C(5))-methyltransferase RsmB [Photobacterium damselae]MBE8130503.1 16S rRNA (cytosine(967)-C(5))-methyltransferase RsmB [Photobacterium damselae subsp. piscicida]MDP2516042.1 16S rRNA (cytosine(967)-C(5))-methyltransferase RsmB [Photobacterium damselae subsp. piscicida]OLQ80748.1 16S rRNA (cytosine(967)-C(5))-methyltransferase [Photobacterium damselae subsp. piscicida]PSV74517.1 16S rRNA (cytosine(967)-C(5))-methyltransferase RsmB [Photobacterium damselae]PSW77873.1 